MIIEPTIHSLLTADAAVMALAPDGCHHNIAPQNARQARIVLRLTSAPRDHLMDQDNAANYQRGRIEARCYATTYRAAKELAQAVEQAVNDNVNDNDLGLSVLDARDVPQAVPEGQPTPTYGVAVEIAFSIKNQPIGD